MGMYLEDTHHANGFQLHKKAFREMIVEHHFSFLTPERKFIQ